MKKAVFLLVCAVIFLFLVPGCGGDSSESPRGAFSCLIDGQSFNGYYSWFSDHGSEIQIWGFDEDEVKYVEITINRPSPAPATITLGSPLVNWAMWDTDSESSGNEFYTSDSSGGTITVTTMTAERCAGTFSFQARNNSTGALVNVTGGSFDVQLHQNPW